MTDFEDNLVSSDEKCLIMGCLKANELDEADQLIPKCTRKDHANEGHETDCRNNGNKQDYQNLSSTEDDGTSDNSSPSKRDLVYGSMLMLLSVVALGAAVSCTQALNKSIPHSELNGLRFSVTLVIATMYTVSFNKCDLYVSTESRGWLFLLAVSYTLTSYAVYGAVYYLPIGVADGLTLSLEAILNNVVGAFLHKYVRWSEVVASVICTIGVLMVTQPPVVFRNPGQPLFSVNRTFQTLCGADDYFDGRNITTHELEMQEHTHHETIIGYTMCVVAAVMSVIYTTILRYKLPHLNLFILNFWISLLAVVTSFGIMGAMERPRLPHITLCVTFLAVHMVTSGGASFTSVRAAQLIPPLWMSLMWMLKMPVLFLLQYTLFSGLFPGTTNAIGIMGAIVIVIGNSFTPLSQLTRSQ